MYFVKGLVIVAIIAIMTYLTGKIWRRETSVLDKIDDIVLKKVCMAIAKWRKEGKILYPVSVNLSRDRLYDCNLVDHLTDIVDSYGVYHDLIDFELTESASYDNTEQMIHVLNELRDKGFHISMDDFGTGYSSLSYLNSFPTDMLKIDKSFIDNMSLNESSKQYVAMIISIGHTLDLKVISEGVESYEQVNILKSIGCDYIQGYVWGRPMPLEDAGKLVISRK